MLENENLLLGLRQSIGGCSRTQQKLGEFVLSDPVKVVYLTITKLICESGTSEASVTRLCQTLGCKGYNEFRMALVLDLRQVQSVEYGGDEIDNVVNESVQALQDTAKLLDRTLLEAATLALHQARSVQIYGVATSVILGEYLHYKLLRLGKPVQLSSDMHRATMNAIILSKDTLAVMISSSGFMRDPLYAVKPARKQGARVLALSNTPRNPLASLSDTQLVAAKPEGPSSAGALDVKAGVVLLVELLTTSLIALNHKYSDVSQQTASATLPLLF